MTVQIQTCNQHDDTNASRGLTRQEAQTRGLHSHNQEYYETYADNEFVEYKFDQFGCAHGFLTDIAIDALSRKVDKQHPGLYEKLAAKRQGRPTTFTPEEADAIGSLICLNVSKAVVRKQVLGEWNAAEEANYWRQRNESISGRETAGPASSDNEMNFDGGESSAFGGFEEQPTKQSLAASTEAVASSWEGLEGPARQRPTSDEGNQIARPLRRREDDERGL